MTVEEIFKDLSAHMIKGVMVHEQMTNYYDFLGLCGYRKCHEYHMHKEMSSLRNLHKYFMHHFNRLIEESQFSNPDLIPSSWYRYTRQDVDANTKRSAVKSAFEKWVSWEKDTKDLYERMYKELMELGEVAAAEKMTCFIHDVDHELKKAEKKHLNLLAVDFSISYIIGDQEHMYDKYADKMRES